MFAIVEIAGQQFKVSKNQYVYVHRLQAEEGATLNFDKVLLVSNDDDQVKVGSPYVDGVQISAKVLSHLKGDKVWVYHKKRRKSYEKKNGHRQCFTKLQIEAIG